jgi:hypothetical protein
MQESEGHSNTYGMGFNGSEGGHIQWAEGQEQEDDNNDQDTF